MTETQSAGFTPPDGEKMSPHFAVFNLHCNNAGNRANAAFKKKYGAHLYRMEIAPKHREGIMSIFSHQMTRHQKVWIRLVTKYVNESRRTCDPRAKS